MRVSILAAALAAALAFPLALPAAAQDARRGQALAADICAACHGPEGRSQMPGVPSLAGQPAEFVTMQMILFREGLRAVPVMQQVAQGRSDQEIEDLAAWFASLPPGPPDDRPARNAELLARGQAVAARSNCGVCHLPNFAGRNQIPRLAGQREDFLAQTMAEYRDNRRSGSDTQMNAVMYGMPDADIAALAHFLSQQD